MYSIKKPKQRKTKKLLIIAFGLIIVFCAGGYFLWKHKSNSNQANPPINYDPPTANEKQQANDAKQAIIDQQDKKANSPSTPSGQKKQASPVITGASTSLVSAYIPGVFEDNGVCTATFTKEAVSFTKTSSGFENVSYTQCAPIKVARSDFASNGTWLVKVSYVSPTSEGSSESQKIEVQ